MSSSAMVTITKYQQIIIWRKCETLRNNRYDIQRKKRRFYIGNPYHSYNSDRLTAWLVKKQKTDSC